MTVKELITLLGEYDGELEVVKAIPERAYDPDIYSESIDVSQITKDDFELDEYYKALVFKVSSDPMYPEDWDRSYPYGIPWKESLV